MKGNYNGKKWSTRIMRKKVVKLLDIHCQLSAVCGQKEPACSTVFNWTSRFNSDTETAQIVVDEWCHRTPKEWFCEAIWNLSRRLQWCIT
jgi:hypothetical protein